MLPVLTSKRPIMESRELSLNKGVVCMAGLGAVDTWYVWGGFRGESVKRFIKVRSPPSYKTTPHILTSLVIPINLTEWILNKSKTIWINESESRHFHSKKNSHQTIAYTDWIHLLKSKFRIIHGWNVYNMCAYRKNY